jgi:hypothetical protein
MDPREQAAEDELLPRLKDERLSRVLAFVVLQLRREPEEPIGLLVVEPIRKSRRAFALPVAQMSLTAQDVVLAGRDAAVDHVARVGVDWVHKSCT